MISSDSTWLTVILGTRLYISFTTTSAQPKRTSAGFTHPASCNTHSKTPESLLLSWHQELSGRVNVAHQQ